MSSDEPNRAAFYRELAVLLEKHGVEIWGCEDGFVIIEMSDGNYDDELRLDPQRCRKMADEIVSTAKEA